MSINFTSMKLSEIKKNPDNPRLIKDDKFKKLVKSIEQFPKMMELRPIVIDADNVVLGGNMRLSALKELGYKEVPDEWIKRADDLTEEQKKEFIIKDNVGFGEWDWDVLANEWDEVELGEWGLDLPGQKETEKLSKLEFASIYYEPAEKPHIKLSDCIDLTLFKAKLKAIEESGLTDEKKVILTNFAYRFIKIDFENVANYYFFNASDEEKKVMERLRLVLSDNGLNGFIEDGILKAHNVIEGWGDD